jgi:5-methylcytosine-specific restriction endonuclease McrA
MAYSSKELRQIYDRTTGKCHICRKKLALKNYGKKGAHGAWEVEHSKPRAYGGSDYLRNLYPACISCNRSKGTKSNRSVRAKHGVKRAPLSKEQRKEAKRASAIGGGLIGAAIGSVLGPGGALLVGAIGAKLAYDKNPDDDET